METFLIKALQLILSLSLLVFVHELGHFMFARLFKVRVEKFYMFFNPQYSLVRMKKIQGKWQVRWFAPNVPDNVRPKLDEFGRQVLDKKGKPVPELIPLEEFDDGDWRKYPETTEWGIGWLPLGGYCKIAGMIDETSDASSLQAVPQDWEFRSKKAWQRMFIIVGGVFMNFIAALAIYSGMLFTWGEEYIPMENAKFGLQFTESMQQAGFQNGDRILSLDGVKAEDKSQVVEGILVEGVKTVTVERKKDTVAITIPEDFDQTILKSKATKLFDYRFPFVIDQVVGGASASKAGIETGDRLLTIGGVNAEIYQDATALLSQHAGDSVNIAFMRSEVSMERMVLISEDGKLGVGTKSPFEFIDTKKISYGFCESIPAGAQAGVATLTSYVKQFKLVFTKEGSKQLGGFGSIGNMFPSAWNWQVFWAMTALLSVILAFMNILPIPALDGGYVIFLIYEMLTGRKPSDKFMENSTTIGFLLLFALLIYANLNDIIKAFL